jgi:hypothetical protein
MNNCKTICGICGKCIEPVRECTCPQRNGEGKWIEEVYGAVPKPSQKNDEWIGAASFYFHEQLAAGDYRSCGCIIHDVKTNGFTEEAGMMQEALNERIHDDKLEDVKLDAHE